jgi:hypothetical protein
VRFRAGATHSSCRSKLSAECHCWLARLPSSAGTGVVPASVSGTAELAAIQRPARRRRWFLTPSAPCGLESFPALEIDHCSRADL